jgi:hypothetical protein
MTIRTKISIITILLLLTSGFLSSPVRASGNPFAIPSLSTLAFNIDSENSENRQPHVLRELSIDNLVTLQIVQQPNGKSNFVSSLQNYVTEYKTAANYGTFGLLAHNYLAGRYFFQISPGQKVTLVFSDKSSKNFVVTEIHQYQALVPDSPSSDFSDLATGEYLTALQLFNKVYKTQTGNLILQTCIYGEQNPSWGRLFVIAEPAD